MGGDAKLTPEACRAARAILQWTVADLAKTARVGASTIWKVEQGSPVQADAAARIVKAFAAKRVEITNGDGTGARLKAKAPKVGAQ